jgi:hypothetical protein
MVTLYLLSEAPAEAAAAAPERRAARRRRVRLRVGRALDVAGRFLCEATIVDLSETGALLRLSDPCRLPDALVLYDEAGARLARARVVRREAAAVALALEPWRALDECAPATRRRLESPYYGAG